MNRYDMFHGHSSPHQLMTRSSMAVFTCVATRSANRRGPAETAATLKKKNRRMMVLVAIVQDLAITILG
jgi:hypothetical protein